MEPQQQRIDPTPSAGAARGADPERAVQEPIEGSLPKLPRLSPGLDLSGLRMLPLREQVASIDPAGNQALRKDPANPDLQLAAAGHLLGALQLGLPSERFDHILKNIRHSSEAAPLRLAALKELISVFSNFGGLAPESPIRLDHAGEPVTLGRAYARALPETTRTVQSFDELLELARIPVPSTQEWRSCKELALAQCVFESSYGSGFLYLKPTGSELATFGREISTPPGTRSLSGVLADALKSVQQGDSFEAGMASLTENLGRIRKNEPARAALCLEAARRLDVPLKSIAITAEHLSGRPDEYRKGEPFGYADAASLLASSRNLSEIAVEHELAQGKLRLADAFRQTRFGSMAELIAYADPARVAGFRCGEMHSRDQQDLAIVLYDWLLPAVKEALKSSQPGPAEARGLLEILARFPRGQLHEPPSGQHIMPVMDELLKLAFSKVESVEDWITVAGFKAQRAAEFECQKRDAIYGGLPKLFGCAAQPAEIVTALKSLGDGWFQRPIDILSQIPVDAKPQQILRAILATLSSGEDHHPKLETAFKALSKSTLARYAEALAEGQDGYSRKELRELTHAYRETSWLGRRINQLTWLWPF